VHKNKREEKMKKHLIKWMMAVYICFFINPAQGAVPYNNTGPCPDEFDYEPAPEIWPSSWRPNVQLPLPDYVSVNCIQNPPGLMTELWASEVTIPGLAGFVLTFDERGRAWVTDNYDYPNVVNSDDPGYEGADQIRIIEDTDGDNIADKSTIFVSGLNQPTAITFAVEGVIVGCSPHILLFRDDNGDDVADDPKGEVLYTGIRTPKARTDGDTHGTISNFHYGLDNWIYGSIGYNGGNINDIEFSSGSYRFKSDGSRFEWRFNNTDAGNSWSHAAMEDGQTFGNHATGGGHTHHEVYLGMPNRVNIEHSRAIHPITDDYNQWEFIGEYTNTSGHDFYTARYLPQEYWNRVAFIGESEAGMNHACYFERNGSSWSTAEYEGKYNIIESTDAWFAPITAVTGPDGAVWVFDWYNYLLLHNPQQPTGAGHAFDCPLRDNTMSRIYRVIKDDFSPLDPVLDLSQATPSELVSTLYNTNMLWRLHAQRLLMKAGHSQEVEDLLTAILDRRSSDEVELDAPVIHALWTLHGYGLFESNAAKYDPILKPLLLHPSYAVRMNALQAMPRTAASAQAIRDQQRLNDPDPHVRLKSMMALKDMPRVSGLQMVSEYRTLDQYSQDVFDLMDAEQDIQEVNAVSGLNPSLPGLAMVTVKESPKFEEMNYLAFAVDGRGLVWVRAAYGLQPGTLRIYTLEGRLAAERQFDGQEIKGSPLSLESKLYAYVLTGPEGVQYRGKIANLN
jgi:putative membrane-bound dehydrogenase-like protein